LQFAEAIAEDAEPYAPPEFALRDIELLNALIMSHFKRQPVKMPVPRAEYTQLLKDVDAGKYPSLRW
jgi:hypothetical protein